MKILITIAFIVAISLVAKSQDVEFTRIEALVRSLSDSAMQRGNGAGKKMDAREYLTAVDTDRRTLMAGGAEFVQKYPTDVRRFDVMLSLLKFPPYFFVGFKSSSEVQDKSGEVLARDEIAKSAWQKELLRYIGELDEASGLSPEQAVTRDQLAFGLYLAISNGAPENRAAVKFVDFRRHFRAWFERCPTTEAKVQEARYYFTVLEKFATPTEIETELEGWTKSGIDSVRQMAESRLSRLQLMTRPLDLKFEALDGREVSFEQLRGKVVLLDFWATWCVPCLEELPKVKRIYETYHDKGFEIIGVSCDYAPGANDTPVTVRQARTAVQVLEFIRKENMPWPQHYAGKKHNLGGNPLATKFGVLGIPAMFLLDKKGMVAGVEFSADQLDAKVKELLAQ